MRLASVTLLLLVACSSSSSSPVQATRANCGPTPEPLTATSCFGDLIDRVQSNSPHGPNYVPPGCPCATFVGENRTPPGGWVAVEGDGGIEH